MPRLPSKLKPARGFSHFLHILLKVLLPLLVYVLVRIEFVSLAVTVILLSKWRMFAVRPRYWGINILSNGVDILVAVALTVFMASTGEQWWQLFWTAVYALWLVVLKPRSGVLAVSLQAGLGQLLALSAVYLRFGDAPLLALVGGTWIVCYICARHFFSSFNEPYTQLLSNLWAYFGASLAFVLGHWLLFYGVVAQITLMLNVVGWALATMYYLSVNEQLTAKIQRQLVSLVCAIIVLVIVLSDWSGRPI